MAKKLSVVQFTHQGKEHKLTPAEKKTKPIIMEWNQGQHRRKFLRAKGQCVEDETLSPKKDLLFWGEWEPYSEVELLGVKPKFWTMPTMVHRPFLKFDKNGKLYYCINQPRNTSTNTYATTDRSCIANKNCKSTDPFVFGDYFVYSHCKQFRRNAAGGFVYNSMRDLEVGSIILFGSTVLKDPRGGSPYFILDTVFVVSEYKDYHVKSYQKDLRGFMPPHYGEIMVFHAWQDNPQLTCYHGATYANQVNGMFSFVPCKSREPNDPSVGFKRPFLESSMFNGIVKSPAQVITDNLNSTPRHFNNTKYVAFSPSVAKQVWDIVKQQVVRQGLSLGVRMDYDIK